MAAHNVAGAAAQRGLSLMADEPRFELISKIMDASATIKFKYGSGTLDPRPFVLTLLPQYVARELGKTLPLRIGDITK